MIIPNKNVFLVTSCIKPTIGVFSANQRLEQTIETFNSILRKVPDATIILCDCSVIPLEKNELAKFENKISGFLDLSFDQNLKNLCKSGMKSHAETLLLLNVLQQLKQNPNLMKLIHSTKRIFKISGRYKLQDSFDITQYDDLYGKYVFRKRIPSWLAFHDQKLTGATDLFVTRLFSFCPSLIDEYMNVLISNFKSLDLGLDTEHSHFLNISKKHLVEFEKVHCEGLVAANGELLED
jgi:hypothetical protein